MRTPILLSGLLLVSGLLSGCSCGAEPATPGNPNVPGTPGTPGTPLKELQSLALSPQDVTLVTDGAQAATQEFRVTATYTDGTTADVTAQATLLADDSQLGGFLSNVFRSGTTRGGITVVRAQAGGKSTSTRVTLVLRTQVRDTPPAGGPPATPADSDTRFGGEAETTASLLPKLVYPNDGVMVPPNLGKLEIHWTKGNTAYDLFELTFSNTRTDVKVYTRCYLAEDLRALADPAPRLAVAVNQACIYTPTEQVWKFIAETNRGGDPVSIGLRATTTAAGGKVGAAAAPVRVRFSQSDIKGALYYWTTTNPVGIVRFDFAAAGATAQEVMTQNNISATGISCVGCHALSRNGKQLVAEVQGQNDGRLALMDLASATSTTKVSLGGARASIFETWNPDGTEFVGVYADSGATNYNLLRYPVNGATVGAAVPIDGTGTQANPANHPDWSPDGNTIAFTRIGRRTSSNGECGTNQRMCDGSIQMIQRTGGTWGAPVDVVGKRTGGGNRYYPAIAPDSSFLVFNESVCGGDDDNCNADTDPSARLYAAQVKAGATPVALARANARGALDTKDDLTNSYPKWSPFVLRASGEIATSRLMYLTFSSVRRYGVRKAPPAQAGQAAETGTLLWMAAVDPDKVAAGEDPSLPAFALPFQDLWTSNHIAQWAEYLVENNCNVAGEGCTGAGTCCNGLQCVDPANPNAEIDTCATSGKCSCQAIPECKSTGTTCSATAECCGGLTCNSASGPVCNGPNCGTCGVPVLN